MTRDVRGLSRLAIQDANTRRRPDVLALGVAFARRGTADSSDLHKTATNRGATSLPGRAALPRVSTFVGCGAGPSSWIANARPPLGSFAKSGSSLRGTAYG